MVTREVIEEIRDRVDIVEIVSQTVTLKRAGANLKGLCPFHQEKTPSFNVVPHKNIYHCFGCGEGGDVFTFVQKIRGIEFFEVVKELGQFVGIEVEDRQLTDQERQRMQMRADLYDVCEAAAQFFQTVLQTRPEGQIARNYLKERGMEQETIEAFRLGFAPARWDAVLEHMRKKSIAPKQVVAAGLARWRSAEDPSRGCYDLFRGRLIIPILDQKGRVVAFGGRILEELVGKTDTITADAPKYVNSPETPAYTKSKVLYGLSQARRTIQNRDRLLVVEGYFDVISLHQAGFTEAVATCGTAMTEQHMRLIRPLTQKVIALFDADEAGVRAAVRSMPLFLDAGIEPRRLDLGDAKDPDAFVQTHGAEAFEAKLAATEPLFELLLRRSRDKHGASPQGLQRSVEELAPVIRKYPSAARSAVVSRVSSALGLREDVVSEWVGRARIHTREVPVTSGAWRGTKELIHLFWLLIHHNDLVAPILIKEDPEPDMITDYDPAKQAFALLMEGRSVDQVLGFVVDADLRRVLLRAAARDALYSADNAAFAAHQILSKLELGHIDESIRQINGAIDSCDIDADESSYFSLVGDRQALQQRKDAIKSRFAR